MNEKYLIGKLFESEKTKEFCLKNNLSEEEICYNYPTLSQYKDVIEECIKCDGKKCTSSVHGMTCHLEMSKSRIIDVIYDDCPRVRLSDPANLEVIDFNVKDIDIEVSAARINLFKLFDKFSSDYFNSKECKGIYLHGKCGVGKSLLLFMFAKSLVGKGAKVLFAYYPDLVRQFQTSFGTNNIENLIYRLKTADILMIDDIGREANTAYIRDEILGPILQYRCDNGLPMFMTSNRDFKLLEKHLSETSNFVDTVKAKAIIERLKYLMKEYELVDIDYRNN